MTNDQNGNGNLPANLSHAAANLLKATTRANPILRYKKGKYFIGEDEVPLGREYIAFPREWTRGWVKWEDGQVVAERLGKPAEGYVPLDRDELGDNEKQGEEDPWSQQNLLPLVDVETDEFIVFASSSFGGSLAIQKVVNRYSREIAAGKNLGNPTIKIDTYDRPSKDYDPIPTPRFIITGWENDSAPLGHPPN
jgi:hypothetical protein